MPATKTQETPPSQHRGRRLLINLLIVLAVFIGVQWYKSRPLASGEAPALRAALSSSEPSI